MLRGPHLKLIASHSVRHGIRGGAGLISLLLTLIVGLALASVVLQPLEELEKRAQEYGSELSDSDRAMLADQVNMAMSKAIDWVIEPSPEQLNYLVNDHPAAVSAILLLLVVVTPLLSCLGGFNQLSGDIASKGLRFLLIRTERTNIFLGRFIGTFLFSACVYAALFLILALYMVVKIKLHSPGDMVLWLASGYLRILLLSLPYIAMCSLVSCAIDSSFGSLTISLLIAYLWPLMIKIASGTNEKVGYLQFLTPWGWKYWLFSPLGGRFFAGVGVMLVFTAVFTFLGHKHFSKRDL